MDEKNPLELAQELLPEHAGIARILFESDPEFREACCDLAECDAARRNAAGAMADTLSRLEELNSLRRGLLRDLRQGIDRQSGTQEGTGT